MNVHTQTLPLWTSSKTKPINPQSPYASRCGRKYHLPLKAKHSPTRSRTQDVHRKCNTILQQNQTPLNTHSSPVREKKQCLTMTMSSCGTSYRYTCTGEQTCKMNRGLLLDVWFTQIWDVQSIFHHDVELKKQGSAALASPVLPSWCQWSHSHASRERIRSFQSSPAMEGKTSPVHTVKI